MNDQPNPYEPPQVPAEPGKPPEAHASPRAGGWWFAGLALLTLCGLFSLAPGLALLFLVLSAPVYIRYVKEFQSEEDLATRKPLPWILRILAAMAFVGGVAAASAGAFLGTCTVTGVPTAIAAVFFFQGYDPGITIGLSIGGICGAAAFVVVCIWLIRRKWKSPPDKAPERSS
jgi:hypothetical protein